PHGRVGVSVGDVPAQELKDLGGLVGVEGDLGAAQAWARELEWEQVRAGEGAAAQARAEAAAAQVAAPAEPVAPVVVPAPRPAAVTVLKGVAERRSRQDPATHGKVNCPIVRRFPPYWRRLRSPFCKIGLPSATPFRACLFHGLVS
ncbi:hypothetical protein ACWDUC_40210, partial [Streptomyces tricolor]